MDPDAPWLHDVTARPGDGRWGRTVTWLASTDSTNRVAASLAESGAAEGHLVGADVQTAGRGRFGRTWTSDAGANLLVSFVTRPAFAAKRWGWIPLAAGLAVAETVERCAEGTDAVVKWPNDVRIGGRKAAGILCEGRIDPVGGFVVVGIGLNVNQRSFDDVPGNRPTSLALETGRDVARSRVLALLCDTLERVLLWEVPELRRRYLARLDGIGGPVAVAAADGRNRVTGTLVGIDAGGALVVQTDAGPRTFASGDVTLRGEVR